MPSRISAELGRLRCASSSDSQLHVEPPLEANAIGSLNGSLERRTRFAISPAVRGVHREKIVLIVRERPVMTS